MQAAAGKTRGVVYTFYSFKGGVGRSMALANVAALLSKWGKKVLVIDWDLEAPGIEKYFQPFLEGNRATTPGLVELVASAKGNTPIAWQSCLIHARIPQGEPVAILHAGQDDERYTERLRGIDWEDMFASHGFGKTLEAMRGQWTTAYDFVLVDSRTGITDIGGICTIHLPDVLLSLFTANEQSLGGVKDVMHRARHNHAQLPLDRKRLVVVPVPARDESGNEFQLASQWRNRFASELAEFFADWIPKDESPLRILDLLKIPYFPYWSFGERLPVVEEDLENPKNLSYSYQLIARLVLSRLDVAELSSGRQATEAHAARQTLAEERAREAAAAREKAQQEAAQRDLKRAEELEASRQASVEMTVESVFDPMIQASRRVALLTAALGVVSLVVFFGVPLTLFLLENFSSGSGRQTLQILLASLVIAAIVSAFMCAVWLTIWGFRRREEVAVAIAERRQFRARTSNYRGLSAEEALREFANQLGSALGFSADFYRQTVRPMLFGTASPGTLLTPLQVEIGTAHHGARPGTEGEGPLAGLLLAETAAGRSTTVGPASASPPIAAHPSTEGARVSMAELSASAAAMSNADLPGDVYVSYRRSAITDPWLREFLPIFTAWLSESLGRDAQVFIDRDAAAGSDWAAVSAQRLAESKLLLAILTPTYFASRSARAEWDKVHSTRPASIVPILFQGEPSALPPEAQRIQWFDMRAFAFVGEGFTRSEKYVEFQSRVQALAAEVAKRIGSVSV